MDDRMKEIETELRIMQKEWIDMYEKVIRLMNKDRVTDYIKDQKHDNDE